MLGEKNRVRDIRAEGSCRVHEKIYANASREAGACPREGAGRVATQRLVLSLLDAECARKHEPAPDRNEADPFSLVQGESQGSGEDFAEAALRAEQICAAVAADRMPPAAPAHTGKWAALPPERQPAHNSGP
jgi:hypothetical protein